MNAIRQVYEAVPDSLPVPPSMRRRRVEVVFLALDEETSPTQDEGIRTALSERLPERIAGALPDLPEREDQSGHPRRVPGSAKGRLMIVEEDEAHLDDFADYMP